MERLDAGMDCRSSGGDKSRVVGRDGMWVVGEARKGLGGPDRTSRMSGKAVTRAGWSDEWWPDLVRWSMGQTVGSSGAGLRRVVVHPPYLTPGGVGNCPGSA